MTVYEEYMKEEFQKLISSFTETTSSLDIEIHLENFCKDNGYKANVSNFAGIFHEHDTKRKFLITFLTTNDATSFAHSIHKFTFGYIGVVVEID